MSFPALSPNPMEPPAELRLSSQPVAPLPRLAVRVGAIPHEAHLPRSVSPFPAAAVIRSQRRPVRPVKGVES